jgi:uncharacterized protein (DUF2235 family)
MIMAKNIVVCADGTWNRPTVHTNVDALFNTLPGNRIARASTAAIGAYEERCTADQTAYYLEGVGARPSRNDLFAGATGTGLHAKVLDGYLLVSRAYQPGDKIFLFGFSRGAYTARSLAALIAKIGLMPIDAANRHTCRDMANQLWWSFKHRDATLQPDAPDAADPCPIKLVGVWDTVGALGIPFFNGVMAIDELERHLFDFADLNLSERVEYGLHALAIDERRLDFIPTPWNPRHGVTQLWFPGVHSDVGGGYSSRELADISLGWMLTQAKAYGLDTTIPPLSYTPEADRHESADSPVWALRSAPRTIADNARFHPCVLERFQQRPNQDYRPPALTRHPQFAAFYTGTHVVEKICLDDHTAPTRRLNNEEMQQVVVLAEKWWNGAGLSVEAGDQYEIQAQGEWNDATEKCHADGWDGYEWLVKLRRVIDKSWFYLCMSVSPDPTLELRQASFLKGIVQLGGRLDSGSVIYPVGLRQKVTVSQPGFVYFFANDAPTHYGNNSGSLDVTIKRIK